MQNRKRHIMALNNVECKNQGVCSTTSWKPGLSKLKRCINKKKLISRIVRNFMENCIDNGLNNLNI